ncbi:GntR family transcriptional regulator [Gracilibacillus halotolerans]|uniref:GntR family transcriptional regulator n=1 Tax=Gracilibacillus halotolerans TaxID=74386 RepID=A0A841RQB3_9BACI|nr:GntR family transcriptional regulator [Gracilibacillus halotolerans]MBB6514042.1 GntR family transcriptional regulator [Gracilibacillus halotolerans]
MENKEMQIIDDIMNRMIQKELQPGEKLPSENKLADKYRVPRITVRNALLKLEDRGHIYSVQGKGRYLKEESIQVQLPLTGSTSFTEKMESMGYDYCTKNIDFTLVPYNSKIYSHLQASESDIVYRIGRIRYINKEPIAIHYSYVKEVTFPTIQKDGPNINSMFAYYRKHGINEFTSKQTLLSVTFPTLEEQKLLACKSMVPLMVVETDSVDKETDILLEYTKIIYRSDRFKYDITIND